MLSAHCFMSMLRGVIAHFPYISDISMSYQLLECLVRTLIDRYQLKVGQKMKFYSEIYRCKLNLQSSLEQKIWSDFLCAFKPSQTKENNSIYSFSLTVFKNFFEKVSGEVTEYDRNETYEIVYKYVALVPILLDSVFLLIQGFSNVLF